MIKKILLIIIGILVVIIFVKYVFAETNSTVCTTDAKQCLDGSYVSRVAPDCDFSLCPDELDADEEDDIEDSLNIEGNFGIKSIIERITALYDQGFTTDEIIEKLKEEGEIKEKKILKTVQTKFEKSLRKGSTDKDRVKGLQNAINVLSNKLNMRFGLLEEDGAYGPKTERAIKNFQKAQGLFEDGIVGTKTQAIIDKLIAKIETEITE